MYINNTWVLKVLKVFVDLRKINMFIDRVHGTNGVPTRGNDSESAHVSCADFCLICKSGFQTSQVCKITPSHEISPCNISSKLDTFRGSSLTTRDLVRSPSMT